MIIWIKSRVNATNWPEKVQEAYGVGKDDAEKQIKEFEERNKDFKAP